MNVHVVNCTQHMQALEPCHEYHYSLSVLVYHPLKMTITTNYGFPSTR